jgi:LysR family transcriptional regulator, nitrogen assimilation regulatory protein
MEIRDLRTFVTTVELGGMTRAADRLHLVQSAVSASVKRLEREVGLMLLERRREGVRPTEAGAALLRYAQLVLNTVEHAERDMAAFRGASRGTVRIGMLHIAAPLVLPPLLHRMLDTHPGLEIVPREATLAELVEFVHVGDIDMLVALSPADLGELDVQDLTRLELGVVMAPTHRLATKTRVPLEELADERWISFRRAGPGWRWLHEAARSHGFEPKNVTIVDNLAHMKAYAEAGAGVSLVPVSVAAPEMSRGTLAAVRLASAPHIAMVCGSSRELLLSPGVAAVRHALVEICASLS